MSGSLQALIASCGGDDFEAFLFRRQHGPPPDLPEKLSGKRYAGLMARRLMDSRRRLEIDAVMADLQRVEMLADARGRDCLEFAALALGRRRQMPTRRTSAFKEALFSFLNDEAIFLEAERIRRETTYRYNSRFHSVYALSITDPLETPMRVERLEAALSRLLRGMFGDIVPPRIEARITRPLQPFRKDEELHLAALWGDRTDGLAIFGTHGAQTIFPPRQRFMGIILNSGQRTLTICGPLLRDAGRDDVAAIINREMLGDAEAPVRLNRAVYDLQLFMLMPSLPPPPNLKVVSSGLTGVSYHHPDCPTSHRTLTLSPSLRSGMLDHYRYLANDARAHVDRELRFAIITAIDFHLRIDRSREFPQGRLIKGRLTKHGFTVDSKMEVDRLIAGIWFDHLRLRDRPLPLFAGAA